MKIIVPIIIVIFLYSMTGWAQEPSIEVNVDRNTIMIDDTLRLAIVIKGGSALTVPDIPATGNFDVVGKSSGSSIEIINGQMSVTKTFDYVLAPRRTGEFTIGPIKTHIDGQTYASGPIQINVLESPKAQNYIPQPPAAPQPGLTPPAPPFPLPQTNPPGMDQTTRPTTYITAETDRKQAYVGEQILFTFRLYTSVSLQNAQLSLPDFKDFFTEELIKERKYEVDLDGKRYAVNEWRLALFPTKAGTLSTGISQVKAEVPVSAPPSPFNDPFFQKYGRSPLLQRKTFSAPSVNIEVKKLPSPPAGFTGLVGQFSMSSHFSEESLNIGDTANLEIELSGKGNIGEATLLQFPKTPFFKIYPGKPVVTTRKTLQGIDGTKKFQYAFVAERPGKASIPSLDLYYFDPKKESYEKLSTPPQTLAIRGSPLDERLVTAGLEKKDGSVLLPTRNLDLAGLKPPGAVLVNQYPPTWETATWFVFFLGAPTLYFLYLIWAHRKNVALAYADDRKRSRAFKNAKAAVADLSTDKAQPAAYAFTPILKKYLSDRFLVKGEALTPLEVESLLQSKEISADVIRKMVYLLDQMDTWKYGGVADKLPDEKELKNEVMNLLRDIEKAI